MFSITTVTHVTFITAAFLAKLFALQPVTLLIRRGSLRWCRHAESKDDADADWVKRCMLMETAGNRQRGRPYTRLLSGIRLGLLLHGLSY